MDDHVSKLEHMGKETVKKLQDIHGAAVGSGIDISVPTNCINKGACCWVSCFYICIIFTSCFASHNCLPAGRIRNPIDDAYCGCGQVLILETSG